MLRENRSRNALKFVSVRRSARWVTFLPLMSIMLLLGVSPPTSDAVVLDVLPAGLTYSLSNFLSSIFKRETLSGKKVECKTATGGGEYTSERLGRIELKFSGCKDGVLGTTCTGLTDKAGAITEVGEVHVRHILTETKAVNVVILLQATHFSCLGILLVESGCVASDELLTESGGENLVNKLVKSSFAAFLQLNGDAVTQSVSTDAGLGMESCVLSTKQESGSPESTSWSLSLSFGTFEHLGVTITALVDLTNSP